MFGMGGGVNLYRRSGLRLMMGQAITIIDRLPLLFDRRRTEKVDAVTTRST